MAYQRSYLGQETSVYEFPVYQEPPVEELSVFASTQPTIQQAIEQGAPPASTQSWWESIWQPTSQVLTTAAQVFQKVYPAIKGTSYPSPYPQTPGIFPGARLPTMTQAPGAMPGWVIPALLGVGAVMLLRRR